MRVNRGAEERHEVRCRRVAQELGDGERLDVLFAGTPNLTIVQLLLLVSTEGDLSVVLLDVWCAFLSGSMRRHVCIEWPRKAARYGRAQ